MWMDNGQLGVPGRDVPQAVAQGPFCDGVHAWDAWEEGGNVQEVTLKLFYAGWLNVKV